MPVLDCAALDDAAGLAVLRRVLGQPRPAAAAGAPGPALCGEPPALRSVQADADRAARLDRCFESRVHIPRVVPASLVSRPRLTA